MKIIRVRNSIGVDYMKEHFVDVNSSKDVICESLKALLINDTENTFILQAWEGDKLVAFLTALNLTNQKYVWLDQAWSDPKTPLDVNDKIFFRFLMWVDSLGKKEVRAETRRDEDAVTRRWKFEKIATVMKFELPENYEANYMNIIRKPDEKKDDILGNRISLEKSEDKPNG